MYSMGKFLIVVKFLWLPFQIAIPIKLQQLAASFKLSQFETFEIPTRVKVKFKYM